MDLDPQWIVGFVDGEGCFHIAINKNKEMTVGYQVQPEFTVTQPERSIQVLYALKAYFGGGVIRHSKKQGDPIMCYRLRDRKTLDTVLVPFFLKHKLKTAKRRDFIKFRRVLMLLQRKEHLTEEGLEKIRRLRESPP